MAHAFDQAWYRVAPLRPRLRLHAHVRRQTARGAVWHIVQDNQTGRYFRISTAAHALLAMMDGTRTMAEIVARLATHMGSARPSHGETVKLLVQLHQSDLLATPFPPDLAELDRRANKQASGQAWGRVRNLLAIRVPLWNPDRFLTRTLPIARALSHPAFVVLAFCVVLLGGVLAAMNAGALSNNVSDRIFAADNVLLIVLLYPLAKLIHEAGHAYAVKLGGGSVHEIGIMILVLFPVPYVDASASAAFPDARQRIVVSSAGIAMELILAGFASIAWTLLPPGPSRAAALDIMLLCGVSTVVFNANPLLRFDGYYVLSDLLGIHNLDTRARKHVMALLRRIVLGMPGQDDAVEAPGEAKWLVTYGLLTFVYRLVMVAAVGLIVATKFFAVGAALAVGSALQMLVLPTWRAVRFLAVGRELRGRRWRAWAGAGAAVALIGGALFIVPVPHALVVPGVVWVPSEAIIRAGADGFVTAITAAPGSEVTPGVPLFQLEDPVATAQLDVLAAEVAVQQSRFDAVNLIDRVQARLVAEQLARARAAFDRAHEQSDALGSTSPRAGRFVVPDAARLVGRFVHEGEVLGYVLVPGDVGVRVVVAQEDLDLVRGPAGPLGTAVDVRLAERPDTVLAGSVIRATPSALDRPPTPALSSEGGGPMLTDPASPGHDRPLDRWFAFDIALSDVVPSDVTRSDVDQPGRPAITQSRIGAHAAARFDLGGEPVAWRLARGARQLVLRTLHL